MCLTKKGKRIIFGKTDNKGTGTKQQKKKREEKKSGVKMH